jgi:hypothetical protein
VPVFPTGARGCRPPAPRHRPVRLLALLHGQPVLSGAPAQPGRGAGRSNCQTFFGISAIPSDNYIRLMLDGAPTAAFDPLFLQAIETPEVLTPFKCPGGRMLVALEAPNTAARARSIARAARRASVRMVAPNISILSWAPASSHPATSMSCPCRRNSLSLRTGRRSRIASATRSSAGWPSMVRLWRISCRFFSATICSPASRSPKRSRPRTAISF